MICKFCGRDRPHEALGACRECLEDERYENARNSFEYLEKAADKGEIRKPEDLEYGRLIYFEMAEAVRELYREVSDRRPEAGIKGVLKAISERKEALRKIREMIEDDERALERFEKYFDSQIPSIREYHLNVPDDPEYLIPKAKVG